MTHRFDHSGQMRAAIYVRRGAAADVLSVVTRDIPVPGIGEVRVRIQVSAVNPSDTKGRGTWRGTLMMFPEVIPHQDGAGVIDAVGPDVSPDRLGERVWVYMAQRGRPNGTAAEYCVVPSSRAIALPDEASFAEGACLGIPAMTAHYALQSSSAQAGQSVLIHGGAGAVGFYATQFAKAQGMRVATTVSREEQAEVAKLAGADVVINRRSTDLVGEILRVEPQGFNRVIDVDFASNQSVNIAALRSGGTLVAFASDSDVAPTLDFSAFMYKDIRLHALLIYEASLDALAAAQSDISKLLMRGRLKHQIGVRLPLDRIIEAHEAQESRKVTGKILLDVV
jgi:NADPH:quinone reductase